jgi:hypothetical protein
VNTLRVKIVLLLVVAIVSVVFLLTVMLFYVLGSPRRVHSLDPIAQQIETLVRVVEDGSSVISLVPKPAPGIRYDRITQRLRDALAARGLNLAVTVTRSGRSAPLIVSIPIKGQYLLLPISDLPPQGVPWWVIGRWLLLIAFGATAIAVFVANRMVRPLVFLENAVASVGPDGMLPTLPEKGPGEVRATAKALNSLSSRLKRAMESRMRLVAAAGHDMRTPITRMRLRAEFVEDEEERTRWLADLDELERIADSAILLVREESGLASPESIRLDQLVQTIGDELREQNLDVTNTARRAGHGVREPAQAQPRASQPHHQRRDAWSPGARRGGEFRRHCAHPHRGRRPRHSAGASRSGIRAVLPRRAGAASGHTRCWTWAHHRA